MKYSTAEVRGLSLATDVFQEDICSRICKEARRIGRHDNFALATFVLVLNLGGGGGTTLNSECGTYHALV